MWRGTPEGFVRSDGNTPWPDEDGVPAHLRKAKAMVPNLNDGRVLRGVLSDAAIGSGEFNAERKPIRNDVITFSTDTDGKHAHGLPAFTGRIHGDGHDDKHVADKLEMTYNVKQDAGEYRRDFRLHVIHGIGGSGNHFHALGESTNNDGNHQHQVSNLKIVPSHSGVRFIIRIQ